MQEQLTQLKKVCESKTVARVLYGIGILVIACLIFHAGIVVGERKGSFRSAWGEHYVENFGMPPHGGFIQKKIAGNFPNAHGAIGKIITINLPTIVVEDKDNTEKSIVLNDETKIINGTEEITASDLKSEDFVVIIGSPDNRGQIEAKFIRIIPSPDTLPGTQPNESQSKTPTQ